MSKIDMKNWRIWDYMPVRNWIAILMLVVPGYLYLATKFDHFMLWTLAAILSVAAGGIISWWARRIHKPFWWRTYGILTGDGRIPLRLFVSAQIFLLVTAGLALLTGLRVNGYAKAPFIIRFVEVELFWSVSSFLGRSADSIIPSGWSKALGLLIGTGGLLFWGMYVSVLVNKFMELREIEDLPKHEQTQLKFPGQELDDR